MKIKMLKTLAWQTGLAFLVGVIALATVGGALAAGPTPEPQPFEEDRLAIPTPPANPTQIELGDIAYYYHCMPCHGDHCQGLTDEFRMVWVDDHRDCWQSGCHGGRMGDEGFPIPRFIPAVNTLRRFTDAQAVFDYLKTTHPPQRPGALTDDEYWALTAYILHQAGRLEADQAVGPGRNIDWGSSWWGLLVLGITLSGLPRWLNRKSQRK